MYEIQSKQEITGVSQVLECEFRLLEIQSLKLTVKFNRGKMRASLASEI